MIAALRERDNSNAAAIAYALGQIGPNAAAAVPALNKMLESPDSNVALADAWALVHICPASEDVAAKAVPVLIAGLSSPLPVARRGAAEALRDMGPLARQALPALQKAMQDSDASVREAAAEAANSIRYPR